MTLCCILVTRHSVTELCIWFVCCVLRDNLYLSAKEDLMRAIKLGENSVNVWNMLGRCEKEFGEPERVRHT